jgi:hypothetical protein
VENIDEAAVAAE